MKNGEKPECTIDLALIRQEVLVFRAVESADKFFLEEFDLIVDHGLNDKKFQAACFTIKDDITEFVMILPDGVALSTIVHEISHVVDEILDYLGFCTDFAMTEFRARLTDFIFDGVKHLAIEWISDGTDC